VDDSVATKIKHIKDFLMINLGVAITAAAVYFFMIPSNVTVGSVSALSMVISNFLPLPVSVITFVINGILMLLSFLLLGREYSVKTVYGSIMLPVFLWIFEMAIPNITSLTGDATLDTLCYILVVGIGLSILFTYNASTGGIETVAKLLNKYFHVDLGQGMSVAGMVVALSSALCFDKKSVVLSVLGTYFGGILLDHFIFGINVKRKVCILSTEFDPILNFILHDLHSGASIYELTGAYDGEKRKEIVTIVDKQEYRALMDFMKKTDPKAFMTVYSVHDMTYQPKK